MKPIQTFPIAAIVLYATLSTTPVDAAVDEAVAKHIPWSGYWWPVAKGELLAPLEKYDSLSGRRALWWELENRPPGPNVPEWHGYCHGWAAASVLEKEPVGPRLARRRGGGGPIALGVADQKGWYAASHAYDVANQYGDRYGDGEGSEDPHDMAPDLLWQYLKMFIKDHRLPLVFDLDAGPEVWNYPVFGYRIEYYPHEHGDGWYAGQLQLYAADDAVPPDFVGTMPHLQTYTFVIRMRGGAVVMGSGRWTGTSISNHPDFAWYPYEVVPENPEIRYDTVKQLITESQPHRSAETPGPGGRPNGTGGQGPSFGAATPHDLLGGAGPQLMQLWRHGQLPGLGAAGAANVPLPISPPQLIATIAEQTSSFDLDARMSQFGKTRYHVGEQATVTGSTERGGHLYVLHVNPAGELSLLYPAPGEDNRIKAGAEFRVPRKQRRGFTIRGPFGNHRIKILVAKRELVLTGLDRRAQLGAAATFPTASGHGDDHAQPPWFGHGFRFCSTQQRQVETLLKDYAQGKSLDSQRYDGIDAKQVLASFAQDEITFYVGPKGE